MDLPRVIPRRAALATVKMSAVAVALASASLMSAGAASAATASPAITTIAPVFATGNQPVTIVVRGSNFGAAPAADLYRRLDVGYLTISDITGGWQAGHSGDACHVTIGEWTGTTIVIRVEPADPLAACFHHVKTGDAVSITVANPAAPGRTATKSTGAQATKCPVPYVSQVAPPYGPQTGGTFSSPSGSVIVTGPCAGSAIAAWFGNVATTGVTKADAGHARVVPPRSPANTGVSVTLATPGGTSSGRCALIQAGCRDEWFWLAAGTPLRYNTPPLNVDLATQLDLPGSLPLDGHICGQPTGGTGTGHLAFGGSVRGGPVDIAATIDRAQDASVPSALLVRATAAITKPVAAKVTVSGSVGACEEIPLPGLSVPDAGLYLVVGGNVTGSVSLTITLARGTWSVTGGWIPGRSASVVTANCTNSAGTPIPCISVTRAGTAAASMAITPVFLQVGPSFAHVGAGLSAAATASSAKGFEDLCAAGTWDATVDIPNIFRYSTGGTWLGPLNLTGDASKCLFNNG